jgi:hypothetical protein
VVITASVLATLLLTVTLLPLGFVMLWKCWDLPPVPLRRKWAVGWFGMALAMLLQAWRAEILESRCQRLAAASELRSTMQPKFRWSELWSKDRPLGDGLLSRRVVADAHLKQRERDGVQHPPSLSICLSHHPTLGGSDRAGRLEPCSISADSLYDFNPEPEAREDTLVVTEKASAVTASVTLRKVLLRGNVTLGHLGCWEEKGRANRRNK